MEIAFILPGGGRSGGVKSTVRAANGLIQRAHEVRLLVNNNNPGMRSKLRNIWTSIRYPSNADWLCAFKGQVERFTNIEQCVFYDHEIVVASGWWAARELRRVTSSRIIKVHHIRGVGFKDNDKMRAAWGENVPKIAVASYLGEVIEKICGQRVMTVIPNGIDTNEYYPTVPEIQRDGVGTIFGSGYHKDPQTVLKVLKNSHPYSY